MLIPFGVSYFFIGLIANIYVPEKYLLCTRDIITESGRSSCSDYINYYFCYICNYRSRIIYNEQLDVIDVVINEVEPNSN